MSIHVGGGVDGGLALSKERIRAILEAIAAVGAPLALVEVALYTDGPLPSFASLAADFTEATFSGYARVNVTAWEVASYEGNAAEMIADPATVRFAHSGGAVAEVIQGYLLIQDVVGTDRLLAAEKLPEEKAMGQSGDILDVIVRMSMESTG